MTTPNFSTNGAITTYKWKKFPLEENNFSVCLIPLSSPTGDDKSRDFSSLLNFIKIIFPEKIIDPEEQTINNTQNKHTLIYDFNKVNTPNWLKPQNLFCKYLQHNHHIITYGDYKNIPETALTNSCMILFESSDDANKYLLSRYHSISLNSFNTNDNFILIDKSIMGHCNIYAFDKKQLDKY